MRDRWSSDFYVSMENSLRQIRVMLIIKHPFQLSVIQRYSQEEEFIVIVQFITKKKDVRLWPVEVDHERQYRSLA